MKKILLVLLLLVINCATNREISRVDDYEICEEENPKDCKYQFENYWLPLFSKGLKRKMKLSEKEGFPFFFYVPNLLLGIDSRVY